MCVICTYVCVICTCVLCVCVLCMFECAYVSSMYVSVTAHMWSWWCGVHWMTFAGSLLFRAVYTGLAIPQFPGVLLPPPPILPLDALGLQMWTTLSSCMQGSGDHTHVPMFTLPALCPQSHLPYPCIFRGVSQTPHFH